ncbi:FAD:protein FMN transferase [Erwinia pyri]|uniref:FAD:protein FMN transferase n=1 Tax=Erwinia pyri TaxID=3062598 RepID=A0AA50DM87_9GAMM|nr:FAD:protein FMN transferase [Erwinia sp. DE2]WLS80514.1 FAD:protein FMN transferase [Erwinia sp. DE2]
MSSDERVYAYSAVLMGSPILLKLFEHDEALAARVFRLIKQYEILLTVNRPESEVMSINHAAGRHPVKVSQPVFDLIACAHAASLLPDSLFNFTIGPLVKRWKIGFRGDSIPPEDEIQALLPLTDPRQVQLDREACTVFLQQKGMEIDLGAIAKGYIADRVRDYLQRQGVTQALINLGGNIQTLGSSPEAAGWGIGLKKPFAAPEALIGVINVRGKSVVTSGIYERYFELNGQRYHHILDPHSGYPLDNELLSVTVISEDSIDGDICTTLLYGMGVEQGLAYLATRPELEAIFVTRARQVICSSQRLCSFTLLDNQFQPLLVTDKTV